VNKTTQKVAYEPPKLDIRKSKEANAAAITQTTRKVSPDNTAILKPGKKTVEESASSSASSDSSSGSESEDSDSSFFKGKIITQKRIKQTARKVMDGNQKIIDIEGSGSSSSSEEEKSSPKLKETLTPTSTPTVAKKRPGRPKKITENPTTLSSSILATDEDAVILSETPKRKRGRPPKSSAANPSPPHEVKRRPGRPKKSLSDDVKGESVATDALLSLGDEQYEEYYPTRYSSMSNYPPFSVESLKYGVQLVSFDTVDSIEDSVTPL
jgi:hypothetical protein